MLVIGITGGMASGKSTVARMLAGRGIRHVDADKLVHDLMRSDPETIRALTDAFPQAATLSHQGILSPASDGMRIGIDRAALARIVSHHPAALATLEAILHPRVRAKEEEAITAARRARARAVILDIPLLFETDAQVLCDVVIVAHAPYSLRRQRAFRRPGMTDEKWRRLLDRQLPDRHRLRAADIIIPTSIGKAATRQKINALKRRWGLA